MDVASYFYKDVLITFLHKSPQYPTSDFLSYFELIESKATDLNVQYMIMKGDLNIDFLKSSTEKIQIMTFMTDGILLSLRPREGFRWLTASLH